MSQTITVRRKDVDAIAKIAFPAYKGPQHKVTITESLRITAADLCWYGGSRSQFVALRQPAPGESTLAHRTVVAAGTLWLLAEFTTLSPWSGDRWEGPIPNDVILVEHRISNGHDLGLTYYVSPSSKFLAGAKHLLQSADPFSTDPEKRFEEEMVLKAHVTLISSYRAEKYRQVGLSAASVEAAKARLVDRGLIAVNKAGASRATVEGKNAYRANLPRGDW